MLNIRVLWGRFVFDVDCGFIPKEPEVEEDAEPEVVQVRSQIGFPLPEVDPVFRDLDSGVDTLPFDPLEEE